MSAADEQPSGSDYPPPVVYPFLHQQESQSYAPYSQQAPSQDYSLYYHRAPSQELWSPSGNPTSSASPPYTHPDPTLSYQPVWDRGITLSSSASLPYTHSISYQPWDRSTTSFSSAASAPPKTWALAGALDPIPQGAKPRPYPPNPSPARDFVGPIRNQAVQNMSTVSANAEKAQDLLQENRESS